MNELEGLKQELTSLEAQKIAMFDSGSADQVIVGGLNKKIHEVRQKISEIEMQQNQEDILNDSRDPASNYVLTYGDFTADFRALTSGDDEFQMAASTTRMVIENIKREAQQDIAALKESHEAQLKAAEDLRVQQLSDKQRELDETRDENTDLHSRLANASNTIADLESGKVADQQEKESLRKQLEELREQITEKPTVVTNLTGSAELHAVQARLEAKKIPVYDVRDQFRSNDGTYTLFKFAETGEPGEIIWTSFNAKYRKIEPADVARFQEEYQEKQKALEEANAAAEADTPDAVEVAEDVTVPFRSTIDVPDTFAPTHGLLEGNVSGEVSPETFEEEVRRRLDELEGRVSNIALYGTGNAA